MILEHFYNFDRPYGTLAGIYTGFECNVCYNSTSRAYQNLPEGFGAYVHEGAW